MLLRAFGNSARSAVFPRPIASTSARFSSACGCGPPDGDKKLQSAVVNDLSPSQRNGPRFVDSNDLLLRKPDYEAMNSDPRLFDTDPDLIDVFHHNRDWVEYKKKNDPEYFTKLGAEHKPKYLYIGCSDARVDPSKLLGMEMGDLFVHRNVGNLINSNDNNFLAVLEYAVNVLKVAHVIVCGHYGCGAVQGALTGEIPNGAFVENWVTQIKDVNRLHLDELAEIQTNKERGRRLVELNVIEQCLNVFKLGTIQRARKKSVDDDQRYLLPRIHGLVFDPADGILRKLDLAHASWRNENDRGRVLNGIYDYELEIWKSDLHENKGL